MKVKAQEALSPELAVRTGSMSFRAWLDLVVLLIQRDLRVRYRGSILGYVWSMLNPLLYMAVLSVVFANVMRFKIEGFPLFILTGIMTWNLFHQSLSIGVNSILGSGALIRKVPVPTTIFPAASVGSVMMNFLFALGPYLLISTVMGRFVGAELIALPAVLAPLLAFAFGLVLILASLNVRYRDIGHVLEPLLTMTFYATPIIYPMDAIPERFRVVIWLNPMSHYVEAMRSLLFEGRLPSMQTFFVLYALGIAALATGLIVHRKLRDTFIYNL